VSNRHDQGNSAAPILDAPIPVAVAVTATGEVLNYAADRRAGQSAVRDVAQKVAASLVPGGVFF
jgi:hypothetical protein